MFLKTSGVPLFIEPGGFAGFKGIERLKNAVWDLEEAHRGSPFGLVTTSMGFASVFYRLASMGWQEIAEKLLKASDQALYTAKCGPKCRFRSQACLRLPS